MVLCTLPSLKEKAGRGFNLSGPEVAVAVRKVRGMRRKARKPMGEGPISSTLLIGNIHTSIMCPVAFRPAALHQYYELN